MGHEIYDILIILGFKAKSHSDDVRVYVPKTIFVADLSACKIVILVIFYSLMGVSYKEYFINWILDLEVYFDHAKVLEYFKVQFVSRTFYFIFFRMNTSKFY